MPGEEVRESESASAILIASLIDEFYPPGVPLTAKYRQGFAFKTVSHRLPVILTKVIDQLSQDKNEIRDKFGMEAREEVKLVIGALAKLKNEMQTNKSISKTNCPIWNSYLDDIAKKYSEGKTEEVKWFYAPWLFVECYMYKRIQEAFEITQHLIKHDPFLKQKEEGWYDSVNAAAVLGDFLDSVQTNGITDNVLQELLEISLWGNRCDLSISVGESNAQTTDLIGQLSELKKSILCDESAKLWETLKNAKKNDNENSLPGVLSIGYILDNSGFELFTDLCFADGLMSLVDKIDFHVKVMPWFVSDVMKKDFHWTLDAMEGTQNKPSLTKLAKKWKGYLTSGKWTVVESPFWTYPHAFHEMALADPKLYSLLGQYTHLIFKGDLNYRKLISDINWPTDMSFIKSLQGFLPAPLISLRTLKADCVSGLRPGLAEEIAIFNPNWMLTGEYGLIQHASV